MARNQGDDLAEWLAGEIGPVRKGSAGRLRRRLVIFLDMLGKRSLVRLRLGFDVRRRHKVRGGERLRRVSVHRATPDCSSWSPSKARASAGNGPIGGRNAPGRKRPKKKPPGSTCRRLV